MSRPGAGDSAAPTVPPAVVWSWSGAAHGVALALPFAVITVVDPVRGMALSIGVLCAAGLGLRPVRRHRALAVLAGAVGGLGFFLGSCVAS